MGDFPLLVLENPLLDIQAIGDDELLQKYDLEPNGAILADPAKHAGLYNELLSRDDVKLIAGGSAQNTARGAQYMLPPDSVVYLGSIGNDAYGKTLQQEAARSGIRTEYRVDQELPTGRCGVIITGHNRSLCTDLAAATQYTHADLVEKWSAVEQAKFFFVGGYHLSVCIPAVMVLAEEALKSKKTFAFSLSAPFVLQVFKTALDAILPYTSVIIGNETEAAEYASTHELASTLDSSEKVAKYLAELPRQNFSGERTVVITQGTDPTIVAVTNAAGETTVSSFPVHPIDKDLIVDTNGAGDAFAGGYMAGLVQGKDLQTCVDMGQWLAARSITQLGPSFPEPKESYGA